MLAKDIPLEKRWEIAKACHAMNRAVQNWKAEDGVCWHDAPEEMKISTLKGVNAVLNGTTPEKLHDAWVRDRLANGWTYSPYEKDPVKKTHPCLVPYYELPEHQRLKDYIFITTVWTIAYPENCDIHYDKDNSNAY